MLRIDISAPIRLMVGVLFGIVLVVAIIVYLAATGIGGASVSTQLTSTGADFTSILPWLGMMVASGLVLVAVGGGRR